MVNRWINDFIVIIILVRSIVALVNSIGVIWSFLSWTLTNIRSITSYHCLSKVSLCCGITLSIISSGVTNNIAKIILVFVSLSILEREITDSSAYNAVKGLNILTVAVFTQNGSSCALIRYNVNDSGFIVIMSFFRFAHNQTGRVGETPLDYLDAAHFHKLQPLVFDPGFHSEVDYLQ